MQLYFKWHETLASHYDANAMHMSHLLLKTKVLTSQAKP